MLGIVTALPIEAKTISRRGRKNRTIQLAPNVLLHIGGIGADAASLAVDQLLSQGATALLSYGMAAGLAPDLAAGSLILPERIIHRQDESYAVTTEWHQHLKTCLDEKHYYHSGAIMHAHEIIISSQQKNQLSIHGAIAADMESWIIAKKAQQANVPFAALRAISDPASINIPALALKALEQTTGRIKKIHFFASMIRHPFELPSLYRLYRCSTAAKSSLKKSIKSTGIQHLIPDDHNNFKVPSIEKLLQSQDI